MGKSSASEQPFPDSWVATTAALSLGIITDIQSLKMTQITYYRINVQ
jgi:hypothetical protein